MAVSPTIAASSSHLRCFPAICYKALCLLERLSSHARKVGKTRLLFVSATTAFGKPITLNAVNQFLERWCDDLDLNEHIHPHQFRKTLAMFLIFQDSRNLGLIRRLFSHKSLMMTLRYIARLPGLKKEILLALMNENKALIEEIIAGASAGKLGGKAGIRIQENMRQPKYAASLNGEIWADLDQYVDALLHDGISLLHRAPLSVICTKTPAIDQAAPCDAPHASRIMRLHPNLANCDSLECYWAVFTERSIPWLKGEIAFHKKLLDNPYATDAQCEFSRGRIKKCEARLGEVTSTHRSAEQNV